MNDRKIAIDERGILVSFGIYSDRPNPYWKLTEGQVEEVRIKLKNLIKIKSSNTDRFNYYGFFIYNRVKIPSIPQKFEVFNKIITIRKKRKIRCFEDKNGLEEWLFELAKGQGHEDIVNWIKERKVSKK